MMKVAAEEGPPAEHCRTEKEECGDDVDAIDLESIWRLLDEPSNPPQGNMLDEFSFVEDLTGVQTSKDMFWGDERTNCGVASHMHNFKNSESNRALSDGFVESARSSYSPGCEMLEPSSQFSQGNDHFNTHGMLLAEDEIEPSESRRALANGLVKPTWNSSFSHYKMVNPYFSQINQGNGLSYMHINGGLHSDSSYGNNDYMKALFETPNHIEKFDFDDDNQRPSDGKGTDVAPYETPNYIETSSFNSYHNDIHKQDSSDLCHLKRDRELIGMEYSFMPVRGNVSEKPLSNFPNEYQNIQSYIPSTDIISRASDVVDSTNGGCPTTVGIGWSSCKNYGMNLKFETEEELLQSRIVLPSHCMPGDVCVKNSTIAAQAQESIIQVSEHPGVMPPSSISSGGNSILKMENEAPKFYDSHLPKATSQGVQSKNSEQINGGDDSDLCIIGDMSAPARSTNVLMSSVGPKEVLPSREPVIQTVTTHSRQKQNNERGIFRVALRDLSQPKSEANPPDGVLSVPLLKHQRIALSWMAKKETRSAYCSGGILADDQGLGKTISTIALILKERAPLAKASKMNVKQSATEMLNLDDDDGVLENGHATGAEHIEVNAPPVNNCKIPLQAKGRPSGGTLIVCPTSVLRQWSDELHNKVTSAADLSVLVYYGTNRTKDPLDLVKYDVVVTTYAIVNMEVPKQPVANESDDLIGPPYKDSSSFGKRKIHETMSDKKSFKSKKSRKGIDSELLENTSGPLAQVRWFRVVLDEAQSIKNHQTQAARACWGLRAKRRWCLSGTPIQNAIDDLYSYFRFLRYEPYAVFRTFCDQLKLPIHRNPRNGYKKLQAILKTIMLRRTKGTFIDGEPIINLPPKTIALKKVEFSKEERDFYCRLEADSRAQFEEYAAAGTVKQNYLNILLMLLRLRQACDHPFLVKGFNSNSKVASSVKSAKKLSREKQCYLLDCLERSLAICGICNDPPEDAVVTVCGHVFCNQCISEHISGDDTQCPTKKCKTHLTLSRVFSKTTLQSALSDSDQPSTGSTGPDSVVAEPQILTSPLDSSKIRAALDLLMSLSKPQDRTTRMSSLENIVGSNNLESSDTDPRNDGIKSETCKDLNSSVHVVGQKAIVFSQWTGMLDLLESCLKSSCIQYRRLDGTMPIAARDKAVKDFNNLPEVSVMIMSLKAASLGLNMVAACNVLLLDLWWNPTTEDQAIDRAHRIGQKRPVSVYRLSVKDTVEDRILALQQKKRKMVAYAFGEDETGTRQSRLTVEDLKYLFRAG